MNELTKQSLWWKDRGVSTIPVYYKGKTPKVGGGWGIYSDQIPDENQIRNWFASRLNNIAVVTGWNNLVVLDFDDAEAYIRWNQWAHEAGGIAKKVCDETRMEFSSRGVHLFIFTTEQTANGNLPGIDILAQRKYCITAPSTHPSGRKYQLIRDMEPIKIDSVLELFSKEQQDELLKPHEDICSVDVVADPWEIAGRERSSAGAGAVERIRNRFRIEDFFPDAVPSGGSWMSVKCPLHEDRRASAGINVDQQIFTCFTHCYGYKPLDVIGLYARMHGLSNAEAIRTLDAMI